MNDTTLICEYRVTKYDPSYRDTRGRYTRDEWTDASDIGRTFAGVGLTEAEYLRAEGAYATAAVAFMREAAVPSLIVTGLENSTATSLPFGEGTALGLEVIEGVVRRLLRGEYWCRLEGAGAFIHVGWDFYMYVGVPRLCPAAERLAHQLGLYVERLRSPYRDSGGF